jgi:hypothetical protein
MSDALIHISNTPIFDALMKERNITSSLSPRSSLRWSQDPVLKPVLPIRDPGASLHVEEPQKPALVLAKTDQDTQEIVVRPLTDKAQIIPLSDTLMFHGISAEEALEAASHFPEYVETYDGHVFEKKVSGL